MGRSYYVPRSVKGESRILYIFTVKSFAITVAFGLIGLFIGMILSNFINISLVNRIIIIGAFGIVGYIISAVEIPDSPLMGPFRKAGGENIGNIIVRFILFSSKKKIYLYDFDRRNNLIDTKEDKKKPKEGGTFKWKS